MSASNDSNTADPVNDTVNSANSTDAGSGEPRPAKSLEKNPEAEKFKNLANDLFNKKDYEQSIELYTKAIELDEQNAVYFANRSCAYLRMESYGYALQDAVSAVKADASYLKGYYRRAAAHMSLGKFKQALGDYEYVAKRRPQDKDAELKYKECQKIINKQKFERAIATETPVGTTLATMFRDLDGISIEDDYTGPKLENDKVTLQFMQDLMEHYKAEKTLHRKFAYRILCDVDAYLRKQKSLVDIKVPAGNKFTICGDIHGQFYDLMNIFAINGEPSPSNPYLFNGDFVDRGSFSVECIFTLFGFKLLYPDHFFLARGNHESIVMNQMYGFTGEVTAKYSSTMADMFTQVYNWLPLSHCINEKILVMHGGLFSQDNVTLDSLRQIDRNRQPPEDGLMCELLWSDPQPQPGRGPSKRGVGIQFGPDITERFCQQNSIEYVVRSHEVKHMGYERAHNDKCITVFSAPNYCDTMGNMGAFITIKGDDLTPQFTTFESVPHPNVRPMAYASSLMNMLM